MGEDEDLVRNSVTACPKILGLEQRIQDLDIRMENTLQRISNTSCLDSGKLKDLESFFQIMS